MSGIIVQTEQPKINSESKAKENTNASSKFCSVCFRTISIDSPTTASCKSCGILAEKECIQDLLHLPNDFVFETWHCPVCSYAAISSASSTAIKQNKEIKCLICEFSGGFLMQAQEDRYDTPPEIEELSLKWLHPYCGFYSSFAELEPQKDIFNLAKRTKLVVKKISAKASEKHQKSIPKADTEVESSCTYCQRGAGYQILCSRCKQRSLHAICAFKENGMAGNNNTKGINHQKERARLICSVCLEKINATRLANLNAMKDGNDNLEISGKRPVRKSSRIEVRAKTVRSSETPSSPEENRDEIQTDQEIKKPQRKHLPVQTKVKVTPIWSPKAPILLLAIVDKIIEEDVLMAFSKEYCTLPFLITEDDIKVIIKNKQLLESTLFNIYKILF